MSEFAQKDGKYYRRDGGEVTEISQAEYQGDTGFMGSLSSGFGLGSAKTAGGLLDAYYGLTGDEPMRAALAQELQAQQAAAPDNLTTDIASGVTQAVPYMLGGLGAARLAGSKILPQVIGQGLAAGAVGGATTVGDMRTRARSAALEAGMGSGGAFAGEAIARIFNRVRGARMDLTRQQRQAGEAMDAGMQLSPGQAAGGGGIGARTLEPAIESMGGMAGARRANQALFEDKLSKALGQTGDVDLSPGGMRQISDDIGARFDEALSGVEIKLTDEVAGALEDAAKLDPYYSFPSSTNISGNQYKQLRRQLSEMADRSANNPIAPLGQSARITAVRDALDDQFADAASPEAKKLFKQAREQWKLKETAQRGSALSPGGGINAASMNSAIDAKWGKALKENRFEGMEPATAEFMDMVNKQTSGVSGSAVGSSGTAERSGANVAQALGLIGGAGYGGGLAYGLMQDENDPLGLMAAAGGSALGTGALLMNYGRLGNLAGRGGRYAQLLGPLIAGTARGLMGDEE